MLDFHMHRRRFFSKTGGLIGARFVLAIALAAIDSIWALYMDSFGLSASTIGFLSAFLVFVSVTVALNSTPILEKIKEYKIFLLSLVVYILSYLLIALNSNLYVFILFSIILTIASIFRIESFSILFRDNIKDGELNKIEAFLYSIKNLGWVMGPMIAALIVASYDIKVVFEFSAIFVTISLFMFLSMTVRQPKKKRDGLDKNLALNFKSYFNKISLKLPYLMSSGIQVWWTLIYIYVPLFMIDAGLKLEYVGYFLAAVTVPLVIFESVVGRMSEKIGFRRFFILGFTLLGLTAFFAFFIDNIYYVVLLFVVASIWVSLIEPLQDSYFFSQVKSEEEEKFYPIFSTARNFGGFVSRFSVASVLLFLSDKFAYLAIALFMFLFAFFAFKIKK